LIQSGCIILFSLIRGARQAQPPNLGRSINSYYNYNRHNAALSRQTIGEHMLFEAIEQRFLRKS
jgi:hypothetical protein